jgi:hypothetical protein
MFLFIIVLKNYFKSTKYLYSQKVGNSLKFGNFRYLKFAS